MDTVTLVKRSIWLLVPLLLWNAALSSRLPPAYANDAPVPRWLGWAEHLLRAVDFVGPALIPLGWSEPHQRQGLVVFAAGSGVYFLSWIPLVLRPGSRWSRSLVGALAPAYLPLVFFAGLARLGDSVAYALVAALFTAVHTRATHLRVTRTER